MKKPNPVQERRRSVRFRILSLVKHATEPHVISFQVQNIQNISRGGLAFFAEQEIKQGAVLKLYFLPPNREKPVEARGKIVRCSQDAKIEKTFELGIEFLEVSDDGRLAIEQLEAIFLVTRKKIRP